MKQRGDQAEQSSKCTVYPGCEILEWKKNIENKETWIKY